MDTPELKALQRAIDALGSQGELAKAISTPDKVIKQQHIWNWLNRDKKVPAEAVLSIERATATTAKPVSRHELRPDIYPLEEAA